MSATDPPGSGSSAFDRTTTSSGDTSSMTWLTSMCWYGWVSTSRNCLTISARPTMGASPRGGWAE